MKKHILFFSLLVTLFSTAFTMTAFAQQTDNQYAVFNWRNDGDFNAFLNCDIDSITYSKIDLNGRKRSKVVVQEIWTPDSLYRIPLTAIDSVTFRAPEPVLKDGIFHIREFHFPYVTDVTQSTVTFDISIPSDSLPCVGQVVISDIAYEEPFVNGFAGRVTRIVRTDEIVRIECEEVSIEDIYDELICVGKVVTYNDSSSIPRAPKRLINEQGELSIPYSGFSLSLRKGNSTVSFDVSPQLTFDYVIRYKMFDKDNNRFRFVVKNELGCDLNYNWQDSVHVDSVIYPLNPLVIHTPIVGLNAYVNIGGYFDFNGRAELNLSQHSQFVTQLGYDSNEKNNGRDGLIFGFDGTSIDAPIGSADIEASLSFGPVLEVGVCLFSEDIAGANLTLSAGPRASGKLGFNTNLDTWYHDHFDDCLQFEPLTAELSGGISFLSHEKEWPLWELPLSDWFPALKPKVLYLFPQFTAPALPNLNTNDYSLTALTTDISRNLIFPITPGIELYQNGTLVDTKFSDKKYRIQNDWSKQNLLMELNGQYPAGTYTAKPVIKFLNSTIKIDSTSTVTIPEALSLPSTAIVKKGEVETVQMNGGWGTYSLENSSQSLFTASFVSADGQVAGTTWSPSGDDNEDPLVRIAGANVGSGTFTVTDLRSKATMTSMVTVLPDVASVISVNPSSLSFSGVPNGAYIDGFTVSGTNLTGNLELNLEDNSGFFTIDRTSISATDAQAGVNVEVEYKPTSNNPSHTAKVTISGGGAQPKTVTLNGSAVEPLSVTPMTLTFSNVVTNTEETKTFRIKGYTASALTLSKSGTSSFYTLSPTTITPAQARDGIDVTVTYKPTSAGTHDATVNIKNSDNTTIETVTLNGTAITPTITVNPSSLTFSGVPNGAYINGFTVFGANLTGNLELELEDNSGFFTINRTNINAEEAETASGASVEVEYKPTSNNPSHTAKVTISGGGAQPKTVTLNGSAVEPFSVTPETLTFSNVVTNTEETKTFRVKGYTASALTLSKSGTSSFYTLSPTTITPAQARDGIDVTVTYRPTSAGTHNATANIKTSDGTTIGTVSLKGTAITPTITVDPPSLSFSGVPNGAYINDFTVKGTNLIGNLKLDLEDNSGFFTIKRTDISAAEAEAATGADVEVEYSPTLPGTHNATVIISSDGASSRTVTLTGIADEILDVTPATLTFSNVPTNTEVTKTFRVKGYIKNTLTLSLSGTSSFYTLSPTTITPAQARDGVTVTVTYKPTSAGTHNATVNIKKSNGTTIATVSLKGTAITPTITVNPSSLTFSGVPNGAYIDGFTVFGANLTGNLELDLEDNSGFFTIKRTNINAAEAETASGASVEVEYKPTSNNPSHTATVTISGGGAQSKTVTLHGSAVEPFSVTPETLTFSNVVTNTEETKTFRIKGYTASALSLSLSGTSSYYTLSKTSITPAQARDGIDVTVTYKPTSAGTHNATVNIKKSNGTTIATVTLNATAVTPTITVNPSSLSFSGVPNGAYLDGFTVKGTNLTGSLKLELKDNSGFFTIDRTSITAAQAASGVSIGVEYSPTRTGHSAATVIISGGGAETKTVQLTGLCKN